MKKIMTAGAILALATIPPRLEAEPDFSAAPGFIASPELTVAGDPATYSPGIHAFDRDEAGILYIFSRNQVVKDPGGTGEVLFAYQTSAGIYGSFVRVRGDTVYVGESSTGTVISLPSDGGPAHRLFSIPGYADRKAGLDFTLAGNFDCAFNSQSQMFLSANPGGWVGENKLYYWDGQTDPVIIADMGEYSGPIAFDRADNLYYGFTGYPAGPEDVVYFTAARVAEAVSSGLPLGSSDWNVLASEVDACSGFAFDENAGQDLYSTSSLGTVSRINVSGIVSRLGLGDSPSNLSFSSGGRDFVPLSPGGGRLSVLCTDWLDYSSTVFAVEPSPQNFILAGGDYSGSGQSDPAIFRPSAGLWAIRGLTRIYFGGENDLPVSGDYDGDGTTDPAVFRTENGLWADTASNRVYFGGENDIPVPRDYNGDGTGDRGIFRPSAGLWAIRGITRFYFGGEGDFPVPSDYGSGEILPGVFRPATGLWSVKNLTQFYFGESGDLPVPADYDGDGTTDAGVYRPSVGLWAIREVTRVYFGAGANWDIPVPLDLFGNGTAAPAVFRPAKGLWAVLGTTRIYFGGEGDFPASR